MFSYSLCEITNIVNIEAKYKHFCTEYCDISKKFIFLIIQYIDILNNIFDISSHH